MNPVKFLFTLLCVFALAMPVQAYDIPTENSNLGYLYVFGPDGDQKFGAEDSEQVLYFDLPASETRPLLILVYDPDTGGSHDDTISFRDNTGTEFILEGERKIARIYTGPGDSTYDEKFVTFGPYKHSDGKKVGDVSRFKLTIRGTEGNDQNLFNLTVQPETVVTYAEDLTFRLASGPGKMKYLYPEIPENITKITVHNYDLDPRGGLSKLYDNQSGKVYEINDSGSGKWAATDIVLEKGPARRLIYEITRGRQIGANAGVRFEDAKGNRIPIYFKGPERRAAKKVAPAPAPRVVEEPKDLPACNRFVFDARDSFDPNNDKITYEWDFGDGTKSTEAVVSHLYQKGGTYKVLLTVSDNSGLHCETAQTAQEVDVNTPPAAAFEAPEYVCKGAVLKFDASASKDGETSELLYSWSFGDGTTAEGPTVEKKFAEGGVYEVLLRVDDKAGTSCSVDTVLRKVRVNTAPVADAGEDIEMYLRNPSDDYRVALSASGSHDQDKDDLTYQWSFGDGATAEGARVEHVYSKPGTYQAKVAVNDQSGLPCAANSDSVNIILNKAPIADAGDALNVCTGREVTLDASGSAGESGETLSYRWEFGDGKTGTGQTVNHRYEQGGQYQAALMVDDGRGTPVSVSKNATQITVNTPPRAVLGKVKKSCVDDKIVFDASGSSDADGDKISYHWDFGDGTSGEGGSKAAHAYKKGGTYKVRVTVSDGRSSSCSTSYDSVTVKINTTPVADAGPNLVCCQEATSDFDASASSDPDGDKLSYNWNFGDGQSATEAQVNHAYKESGQYQVVLVVDDNSGTACSSATDTFVADVNAKPVPKIRIRQS